MARQNINLGTEPNDGEGDNLRTAFDKVNDNFIEVYTAGPVGSNIVISGNVIAANVTNANIELSPNGIGKVVIKNDLLPDANNTRYIGSTTSRPRGVYVGSAGINSVGDISTDGNITANNIRYTGEVFVGDLQGSVFADDSTTIVDAIDNAVYADTGVFGTITAGNILPAANVTYNLGSPTAQWQTLYVSGNTIYLDGTALSVSGNILSVAGSNVAVDGAVSYTVTSNDVTQHQANLSITESQISDLQSYITGYTVTTADVEAHEGNLELSASQITSGTFANARISSDSVVQHQANLTITESQISDLGHSTYGDSDVASYLLTNTANIAAGNVIATFIGDVTGNLTGTASSYNVTSNDVTQHQANLSITESQISDLSHTSTGNFTLTNNTIQTNDGSQAITLSIQGADATDPPAFIVRSWSFANTGAFTSSGPITATGNVTGDNFIGNIEAANVVGTVATATTAGTVTTAAQPNITSVGTLTSVTVTGNVAGGNLTTAGQVVATGNVTGANFIGSVPGYVESDTTGITGADAVTNMVSLTQAEYDAITPNASTVYIIVG